MKKNSQKPYGEPSSPRKKPVPKTASGTTPGSTAGLPAKSSPQSPSGATSRPAKPASPAKTPNGTGNSGVSGRQRPQRTSPKLTKATSKTEFAFDVCVSFAGENREYVEKVVRSLQRRGISCFYDLDEQATLWGKDLISHLDEVYRKKARFCAMFISEHYARKLWTNHERQSIQARTFESNEDYLLPVRLDDTEVPGLRPTLGYIDGRRHSPSEVAAFIKAKVTGMPVVRRPASKGAVPATATTSTVAIPSSELEAQKIWTRPRTAKATSITTGSSRKVNGSGKWIMLGDSFFEATRVIKENDEFQVQIAPHSSREEAELKSLESRPHWNRTGMAFAHGNDAVQCQLQKVSFQSENGKVTYMLSLQKETGNSNSYEMAVQGMSADQIAEKRARLVLLGEKPSTGDSYCDQHITRGYGDPPFESGVISKTLKRVGGTVSQEGLQKARLVALYQLVSSGIIEHVLELAIGPVSSSGISVLFEGQRHAPYTNQAPVTFRVKGQAPIQ